MKAEVKPELWMANNIKKSKRYLEISKLKLKELDELMLPIIHDTGGILYEADEREEAKIKPFEETTFTDYLMEFEEYIDRFDSEWKINDMEIYRKIKNKISLFKQILYYYEKKEALINILLNSLKETLVVPDEKKFFEPDKALESMVLGRMKEMIRKAAEGKMKRLTNLPFERSCVSPLKEAGYPEDEIDKFKKLVNEEAKKAGVNKVFFLKQKEEEIWEEEVPTEFTEKVKQT